MNDRKYFLQLHVYKKKLVIHFESSLIKWCPIRLPTSYRKLNFFFSQLPWSTKAASPCDHPKDLWLIFFWFLSPLIICNYDCTNLHTYCRPCIWSQTLSHAFRLSSSQIRFFSSLATLFHPIICRHFQSSSIFGGRKKSTCTIQILGFSCLIRFGKTLFAQAL